tara:strand:- start:249 stop:356 length:108 start_codon:yes stop_codon:yes gene_type:complete
VLAQIFNFNTYVLEAAVAAAEVTEAQEVVLVVLVV